MKKTPRNILFLPVILLGASLSVASFTLPTYAKEKTQTPEQRKVTDVVNKVIDDAMEKSKKEGKPVNVDIDLEALAEDPKRVQKGDLVEIHITARDEQGKLLKTTRADIANDPAVDKLEGYEQPASFGPEQVVGGQASSPLTLGEAIVGMEQGQKKTITVPPDKAFGNADSRQRKDFPCFRSMPRVVRLSAEEYTARYQAFPKLGQEVDWVPYFKARTKEITDRDVALELLAKDGDKVEEAFGTTEIQANDEKVTISLKPRLGAPFIVQDKTGKIVTATDTSFTVDFNHPFAGKKVVAEAEVLSFAKASSFKGMEIPWFEDHDQGLALAKKEGKPAVLVLYADWCGYCKRLFGETFQDPRIKSIQSDYVWMKVNSDKEKKYGELYGQNGFPLIVIIDKEGKVFKKIDGFRDAGAFRAELSGLEAQHHAGLLK